MKRFKWDWITTDISHEGVEYDTRLDLFEHPEGELVEWKEVKGLIRGYVRNGIKAEEENTRLKEALRQVKRYACSMDINYLSKIYDVADEALRGIVKTEDEWTNQLPSEEDWGEGE